MESILKSEIFFFVTTVVVVGLGAALLIALVYVIKILRDVKEISRLVKEEGSRISGDLAELHEEIRREGLSVKRFFQLLFKTIFGKGRGKK